MTFIPSHTLEMLLETLATSLYNNIKLFRIFMYIMSFILVSGTVSSHFADTTKSPGNSYDDKGNGN